MTVKELIEKLQKIENQNVNVYIYDLGYGQYLEIENIDETMDNKNQIDINVNYKNI